MAHNKIQHNAFFFVPDARVIKLELRCILNVMCCFCVAAVALRVSGLAGGGKGMCHCEIPCVRCGAMQLVYEAERTRTLEFIHTWRAPPFTLTHAKTKHLQTTKSCCSAKELHWCKETSFFVFRKLIFNELKVPF